MAKPNIKPVGSNILVKPLEEEKKTDSGIVLPDTVDKEKPQKGEVVALGTRRLSESGVKIDFTVKVGDKIIFKKYSPDEVEVDGTQYLVMSEDDILAVIK
ncbi:co-chaperone GroES [Candidatus Dojkabacteria bacterium]|nr:co-chaperone GroES [Candidatus Dojkabacteria bacterium]